MSEIRNEIMEKLKTNAYSFDGICKVFKDKNLVAETLIVLAYEGKLEIRYHKNTPFMIMKDVL